MQMLVTNSVDKTSLGVSKYLITALLRDRSLVGWGLALTAVSDHRPARVEARFRPYGGRWREEVKQSTRSLQIMTTT